MAILIIDDQQDMRDSLQGLLAAYGYADVQTVGSGRQALELLRAAPTGNGTPVDLILTDVSMPGLSGIDVCREIKATPKLHDIPILVLTGMADETVLEEAFAAGAHDFIPKPANPPELVARVRAALNLKAQLDQRKARERELVDVTDRLRRLAIVDELTQVPNRRYFNLLLRQEWARAAREVHPLSLILIDVDCFKGFNDRYGHPAGDVCLARVAETLQGLIRRPGDAVCRFGGEEFAVLLGHTSARGAMALAEILRTAIENLNIEHLGVNGGHVTISLGVASAIPERGSPPDRLIAAADQALYDAKAAGRNRVIPFQGSFDTLPVAATPIP